jgi:hypothetical protein
MNNLYTIERFEKDYAVCNASDGRVVDIPFEDIPENSQVGDVLRYRDGKYVIGNKGKSWFILGYSR